MTFKLTTSMMIFSCGLLYRTFTYELYLITLTLMLAEEKPLTRYKLI